MKFVVQYTQKEGYAPVWGGWAGAGRPSDPVRSTGGQLPLLPTGEEHV